MGVDPVDLKDRFAEIETDRADIHDGRSSEWPHGPPYGAFARGGRASHHDYIRHGTTTLFAALNVLDGTVLGRCMQRHRHQEFIRFLNAVEAAVPAGKLVHVILDNYATHKHPKVVAWLARHPRWTFHYTPTSSSWLNAVETFFSAMTRRRLRRGVFRSLVDLQAAINRYLAEHNADPKPFTWTATPAQITAKLERLNASVH
jgi:transposase